MKLKMLFVAMAIIGVLLTLQVNGALAETCTETVPPECNADGSPPVGCETLPYFCNADGSPNPDLCKNPGEPNPDNQPDCMCTPDYSSCPDCTPIMVCTPSESETTLVAGDDFWPNNMYDFRTYHESHPKFGLPNNSGSNWVIGLTVHNSAVWDSIGEVNITHAGTIEDMQYNIKMSHAAVYPWGGSMFHDWSVWLNNLVMLPENGTFEITAKDNLGAPIEFNMDGNITNSVILNIDTDDPLPPICDIKHMAIKKNGMLKMRFTVPYDLRDGHIRIRIFDAEDKGLEYEHDRIYPPFQIVKKNGTIIPDKVRVTDIPAEYAGRTGRIEYRVNTDTGVLYRGITYFKLPELEEDEEE